MKLAILEIGDGFIIRARKGEALNREYMTMAI